MQNKNSTVHRTAPVAKGPALLPGLCIILCFVNYYNKIQHALQKRASGEIINSMLTKKRMKDLLDGKINLNH